MICSVSFPAQKPRVRQKFYLGNLHVSISSIVVTKLIMLIAWYRILHWDGWNSSGLSYWEMHAGEGHPGGWFGGLSNIPTLSGCCGISIMGASLSCSLEGSCGILVSEASSCSDWSGCPRMRACKLSIDWSALGGNGFRWPSMALVIPCVACTMQYNFVIIGIAISWWLNWKVSVNLIATILFVTTLTHRQFLGRAPHTTRPQHETSMTIGESVSNGSGITCSAVP